MKLPELIPVPEKLRGLDALTRVEDALNRLAETTQQAEDMAAALTHLVERLEAASRCRCGGHERVSVYVCKDCGGRDFG